MKKIRYYLYALKLMWGERKNRGRAKRRRIVRALENVMLLQCEKGGAE